MMQIQAATRAITWPAPRRRGYDLPRAPMADARDQAASADTAPATAFDERSDDRTLIGAAVSGDRAAFDLIVERHRRTVYQVCYRFVGNHEDASDLAQDAFIRAYRALAKFKGESELRTWLYRIAVNVCLNRMALKTPAFEAIESERHLDTRSERPDEPVYRAERAELVKAAI